MDRYPSLLSFRFINLLPEPGEDNTLNLKLDDVVTVIDDSDPDWTLVETKDGAQGYWPKNFLEFLAASAPAQETPAVPQKPAMLAAAEAKGPEKVEIAFEVEEGVY